MKKAFTLSEALITLAIIGVLAAILVPVIDDVRPDKDKVTYKKAMYNVQSAISSAMDSGTTSFSLESGGTTANATDLWQSDDSSFCNSIAGALNTSGSINCSGPSSYQNPNFITSDGIRYWGLEGKPDRTGTPKTIYVDRNIGSNELKAVASKRARDIDNAEGLKIQVRYDGKVSTPDSSTTDSTTNTNYNFENDLIEDSLSVR